MLSHDSSGVALVWQEWHAEIGSVVWWGAGRRRALEWNPKMTRVGRWTLSWLAIALALSASVATVVATPAVEPEALPNSARFTHLTIEQGLSDQAVTEIVQDRDGFMWFGTANGLNRFDGYTFVTYRHDPMDPYSIGGNQVNALLSDRSGALWVGGRGVGLNMLDRASQRFTRYRTDPNNPRSLSSDSPRIIYEDRQGTLWIGTERGLNRLDSRAQGTFTRFLHDPATPDSLSDNFVLAMAEDRAGALWIGTADGLDRFNPETSTFAHYRHTPNDPRSLSPGRVFELLRDRTGVMWIATDGGGLSRLDDASGSGTFTRYRNDPADRHSLSADSVDSLLEDDAGRLWVGTFGGGVSVLDRDRRAFTVYRNDPADPTSLSFDQIAKLYRDRSGLLWIATGGGGIDVYNPQQQPFALYRQDPRSAESLASNFISAVYEDSAGNVWVGTRNNGLDRLDLGSGHVVHYPAAPGVPGRLGHPYVSAIQEDPSGNLWIATYGGGVYLLDPASGYFTAFQNNPLDPASLSNNNVFSICIDETGTLWVGMVGGGVDYFDRSTGGFVHHRHDPNDPSSLSSNTVLAVASDSRGSIWVGVAGEGLQRLDTRTGAVQRYRHDTDDPTSLSNNTVYSIAIDRAGTVWAGTFGGGLNRFDSATGKFRQYHDKDGLAGDKIYSIMEDGDRGDPRPGNLWIATGTGLSKFDRERMTWQTYDTSNGLPRGDLYYARHAMRDGRLLIGTLGGLIAFDPRALLSDTYVPQIAFTDFLVGKQSVTIGGDSPLAREINQTSQIEVPYTDRVVSFEFAALNYRAPRQNRYRYILEGFDRHWTEVGAAQRLVTYTNLDPGTYVFRVTGSNGDGVWNETGRAVTLVVSAPWWATWWFRFFVASGLIATTVGIYLWRVNGIRKHSRELELLVAERTRELAALLESRDVFLRALAHDLKAPLMGLGWQVKLLVADMRDGPVEPKHLNEGLRRIAASAAEAVGSIDELHDLTRMSAGSSVALNRECLDLVDLVTRVATAERLAGNPRMRIASSDSPLIVEGDRARLSRVIGNLLDNAVKYSDPSDTVVVQIGCEEWNGTPYGFLEVVDSGRGIPAADLPHIFERYRRGSNVGAIDGQGLGLASAQYLVELHGGRLTIESREGRGTTAAVWLPLARQTTSYD